MQENTTTTNVVVVVHNNQIVGGLHLGRALTDGDWIGQEIDHTQTHNKEEEEATTDEVCGVGGQGDERSVMVDTVVLRTTRTGLSLPHLPLCRRWCALPSRA
jgi:hypothetical protein